MDAETSNFSNGPELVAVAQILETFSKGTGKARDNDKFAVWRDAHPHVSQRRPVGNWALLNATWEEMEVLTGKIWASPGKGLVHLCRARVTPCEGIVLLADCIPSPRKESGDGVVLWGAIKTVRGLKFFSLVVYNGVYRILFEPVARDDTVMDATAPIWSDPYGTASDPVRLIGKVIAKDRARLLSPPQEDGVRFEDLSATRLLSEVRGAITTLGDTWWGLYAYPEKLPEVKPNAGIVFCYMGGYDAGYLFDIATDECTRSVLFCSTPRGFQYVLVDGTVRDPFKSVSELLAHIAGCIELLPAPPASVVTRAD